MSRCSEPRKVSRKLYGFGDENDERHQLVSSRSGSRKTENRQRSTCRTDRRSRKHRRSQSRDSSIKHNAFESSNFKRLNQGLRRQNYMNLIDTAVKHKSKMKEGYENLLSGDHTRKVGKINAHCKGEHRDYRDKKGNKLRSYRRKRISADSSSSSDESSSAESGSFQEMLHLEVTVATVK